MMACLIVGQSLLAHSSCGCSWIDPNTLSGGQEVSSTMQTQMLMMIESHPSILINMGFTASRASQYLVFYSLRSLRF